jgi:hypothetical protein
MPPDNGWNEWGKYVLKMLEANQEEHGAMMSDLSEIKKEIAVLKIKAGVWGAVAGIIAGATPLLLVLLTLLIRGTP